MDSDESCAGICQRFNQLGRLLLGELHGGARRTTESLSAVLQQRHRSVRSNARDTRARANQVSCGTVASSSAMRGGGESTGLAADAASDMQPGSGKKKKKKDKDGSLKKFKRQTAPMSLEEFQEALEAGSVPSEDVELMRAFAWKTILENEMVKWKGKKMTAMQLAREAAAERKLHAVGGDQPTMRTISRAEANARVPSVDLRPEAHKMMLRTHEQDQLPLDMLGQGHAFSEAPVLGMRLGGKRDYTFAIYGNGKQLTRLLRKKWGGMPPEEVVGKQELYDDLMKLAPAVELTVMALPVRRFAMASVVDDFRRRMSATLARTADATSPPAEDAQELAAVAARFTAKKFEASGLVDKEGRMVQDSHFIFSTGTRGQLDVEAVTPGALRDRSAVVVGSWAAPRVAQSLMDQFLGESPVDFQAKMAVGHALAFLANGFDLHSSDALQTVKNQYLMDDDGSPIFPQPYRELIPAVPEAFSFAKRRQRPLLDCISREKQWQRQQQQQKEVSSETEAVLT